MPALIGLDWGTTTLRAYLMSANGRVMDQRAEPWGIMQLGERDFARANRDITGPWQAAAGLPVIASGMVGSAQGWIEAPYCTAAAGATELAKHLIVIPGADIHIVPGVAQRAQADVMRGEETQVIGAVSMHPQLRRDSLVICPGTHSKWVRIRDARISAFTTYMTGELFSVLSAHSILGRLAGAAATPTSSVAADAFVLGVRTARDSARDTSSLLFSARARVLLGELAAEASLEYLSGLLIGNELRSALAAGPAPDALIGDVPLCARYARALGEFDLCNVPVIDGSAPRGLWEIAKAAELWSRKIGG